MKYFSDILCPWCWGEEKVLRVIDYTFPTLQWEYRMGNLIENYENFLPPNFRNLNSAEMGNKILYDMYRAAATVTNAPYYESVPNLFTKSQKSSFPLNIFAVAVRRAAPHKLGAYLRKVKEATIYDNKNIYSIDVQKEILSYLKVDLSSFEDDLLFAQEDFLEDRMEGFDDRIKTYPVFLWEEKGHRKKLTGYQSYDALCHFLKETEGLDPLAIPQTQEELEKFIYQYENILKEEAQILFSKDLVEHLISEKRILEQPVCGGTVLHLPPKK